MLFKKNDFDNPEIAKLFHSKQSNHFSTWKHYYDCYNYALEKIFHYGLKGNYVFNSKAKAILFLLRQSLELCLKYNLELKNLNIPNSHDFDELYSAFSDQSIIPQSFKNAVNHLNFDEFGASFRYYENANTSRPFFERSDQIQLTDFLEIYNSISSTNNFFIGKISDGFDYSNNKTKWALTFHLGDCTNLYNVKHQYDETIELLIEGIIKNGDDVKTLYLPILFLIRHSLEIGLKFNILEIQRLNDSRISEKDYKSEHSIETLYNCYYNFLSKIDKTELDAYTQNQLQQFIIEYQKLNSILHNLDINSFFFRFPVDRNGINHRLNLTRLKLINIIKLFYFTDPFITFTNNVLDDFNIIIQERT